MSESPLVRRGVPVEVETVTAAELDLALLGLDADFLQSAARTLADLPISRDDAFDSPVRIRVHRECDLAFIVSRSESHIVVTIMRIWPTRERDAMRATLQTLDLLAMLRGATGL